MLTSTGPRRTDSGASSVEYGLLIALIALVIVASVTAFGGNVVGLFDRSCGEVARATAGGAC